MGLETEAMLRAAAKSLLSENQGWTSLCEAFGRALLAAAEAGPQPISPAEFVHRYGGDKPPTYLQEYMRNVEQHAEDAQPAKKFYWPTLPILPSVILHDIGNSTKDGQYVDFATMCAREALLSEYALAVLRTAYALVDEADAARKKAEHNNLAKNKRLDEAEAQVRELKREAAWRKGEEEGLRTLVESYKREAEKWKRQAQLWKEEVECFERMANKK